MLSRDTDHHNDQDLVQPEVEPQETANPSSVEQATEVAVDEAEPASDESLAPETEDGDGWEGDVSDDDEEEDDDSSEIPSMADYLDGEYDYQAPKRGEIRKGEILSIRDDGVVVDIGLKQEALVPAGDLTRLGKESRDALKVGDEVHVTILRPQDREGNLIASIYRARQEKDWIEAEADKESARLLELVPVDHNRGGLVVHSGKIRGFVPASQLMRFPMRLSEAQRMARLASIVEAKEEIPLKIIEVDRRRRRLIFSQRSAWWEWKEQRKRDLIESLEDGTEVEGTVTSLRDFGAFIDLGGADGLIHVSEISWEHIKHPKEVLQVGQKVKAKVLSLDRQRMRIGLSLKQMEPEPWSKVDTLFGEGQLVEGVVTRVTDFGAFVRIREGIEGLIHVSELADITPERPGDLVNEGDLLLLRIIRIDAERRRIGLSLRQVTEEEWGDWVASFPVEKTEPQAEEAAEDGDVAASEAAAPGDALELDATAEAPAEAEALSLAVEAEDPRGGAEEVDPQDEDPEAEGAATD